MKITDVAVFQVQGTWRVDERRAGFLPGNRQVGNRQAQMLDVYPEFNARSWAKGRSAEASRAMRAIYVEVQTDEARSGIYGPIGEYQAFLIDHFLRGFLIGRDPLATELLHDQMLRLHRHGRSGMFMTAISAVDCALWDLKGKAWDQPVYRLLGGPVRETVPAYASMLGFSIEPEAAAEVARAYKAKGFSAQKWFFRYGPGDGEEGKARNLALVQALREAVGPYYTLMFDAFMGWDMPYARAMMQALAPLTPTWVEEPLPPERVGGLHKLRAMTGVPVSTGEHVYTRWQVKELLEREAVDFVQTDPDWTGGITELVKICALASAFDVPVVAHGHSLLPALHVAGSQSPTVVPFVEFLIQHQEAQQFFHIPIYWPENGTVHLPDLPGLGMVLDEAKIEAREDLKFSTPTTYDA